MTDKAFALLWGEALVANDRDVYVAEWSISSVFPEDADLLANAEQVGRIWDVAHMSVQQIVDASGCKRTVFAERFCIPYRTLTNWCRGERECPDYTRLMMAELLGLVDR